MLPKIIATGLRVSTEKDEAAVSCDVTVVVGAKACAIRLEQYFVSNDGTFVVDAQKQIVGVIKDGVFEQLNAQNLEMLKKMGVVEGGEEVGEKAGAPDEQE